MRHSSPPRRGAAWRSALRPVRPDFEGLEGRQLLATVTVGQWTYTNMNQGLSGDDVAGMPAVAPPNTMVAAQPGQGLGPLYETTVPGTEAGHEKGKGKDKDKGRARMGARPKRVTT